MKTRSKKCSEQARIAPELAVRLYANAIYCSYDSGFMNGIAGKFIRQHRLRRDAIDKSDIDRHSLALRIASQSIDWFFWALENPTSPYYHWQVYDADWIIDNLLEGITNFFPSGTMEHKFYSVAEEYWAVVRDKKHSERFTAESIADALLTGQKLARAIRSDRRYSTLRREYSVEIADRIFHDRQMSYLISDYISRSNGIRRKFDRVRWPSNLKRLVFSRDRGKCAMCHCDIAIELLATAHLDHIVPISRGGSNDILNLQLLCSACNLKKASSRSRVASSVPKYHKTLKNAVRHRRTPRRQSKET